MKEVHSNEQNNRKLMHNPDLVELGKNIQKQREFMGMSQECLEKCDAHFSHSTYHYLRFWRFQEVDGLFTIYSVSMGLIIYLRKYSAVFIPQNSCISLRLFGVEQ